MTSACILGWNEAVRKCYVSSGGVSSWDPGE
jgi:hypothetical protein